MTIIKTLALATALTAGVALAQTAPATAVTLTLKDHVFTPAAVTVPAGQKITVTVINKDKSAEEFESHDLKVEKIVTPGGKITVTIGPLKPGTYSFVGEFHAKTAKGTVTAVAPAK